MLRAGKIFLFCLFFLFWIPAPSQSVQSRDVEGKVSWVYDGDTVKVLGVGKVRLIGIDTPERKASERDRWFLRQGIPRERLRRVADEVLKFNISTVKGKNVRLTFDHDLRDRHGRILAYVHLPDGRLLNRILLENGYAAVYRRFDFEKKEDFLRTEAEARVKKVGLWESE